MHVTVFSTHPYDQQYLDAINKSQKLGHTFRYVESRLTLQTAPLADGSQAVCAFVNDQLGANVLARLKQAGVGLIALRCAGFNQVDLAAAHKLGVKVARVPAYSPASVAEHTFALILTLNRNTHRAYNRVREGNFALDGLMGFDLKNKTVGVIGTGKIGSSVCQIAKGFGCRVLAYDLYPDTDLQQDPQILYVELDKLISESDIVTLHCPLTPQTKHLVNQETIAQMKPGVMLINTSRGALLNTVAAIEGLKAGKIGALGLDVYEEEADLFFEDLSKDILKDDVFARLLTFPNVVVTGHQAFFTHEAMTGIAGTTLGNISDFEAGKPLANQVL